MKQQNKVICVRQCSYKDELAWDNYISSHQDGNFYQLFGWKNINEHIFGNKSFYLIAESDHNVIGAFPIINVKSLVFGNIMSSMPFVNYGGICSDNNEITQSFLDAAKELCKDEMVDYMEIRSIKNLSNDLPTTTSKISMTLNLNSNPDVIWNDFKTKHRTNIRRVYKDGITIKSGHMEMLDTFYNLLASSWKNLGTPIYNKSYFQKILDTFPKETRIFVAYYHDIPIATAFNGYYKGVVEGMWAGALPEYRDMQANYALYWEMIKDACEKGMQRFHLGRSTADSGAEAFKKKWNAYGTQLYWQYILNKHEVVPQLNTANPKYALAINLWRKLPLQVTTAIGQYLARRIP